MLFTKNTIIIKLLLILIFLPACATGEPVNDGNFSQRKTDVFIKLEHKFIKKIDVSNLMYRGSDGLEMPTSDLYVTQYNRFGYPLIIDSFEGHTAKLEQLDLNNDGIKEVIIKYNAGAHQTFMRVYQFENNRLKYFPSNVLVSNMGAIELIVTQSGQSIIEVKNTGKYSTDETKVIVEYFQMKKSKFTQITNP